MPTINILNNSSQSNFVNVQVVSRPTLQPSDLIWTVGPSGTTTAGVAGSIFTTIIQDNAVPPYWYHGGNFPIDVSTLAFDDCNNIQATYSTNSVVSGTKKKGIFELRLSNPVTLASVASIIIFTTTITVLTTTSNHGLVTGDMVFIDGVTSIPQINGYWYVTVGSPTTFVLKGYAGGGNSTSQGTSQKAVYYWDEVYTTPIGLFSAVDAAAVNPVFDQFLFTNNDSNEVQIYIEDPNIVPQSGDSIVFQRFFDLVNTFTNQSTTDGINNVVNFPNSETYTFKITNVSSSSSIIPTPHIIYTLTLDKSFAPFITSPFTQYMIILLNRTGIGVNKELFTDTWQTHEVHREQLLGDPYNYIGVLQPRGRKNYLYYESAKYLGVGTLLGDILTSGKTPFIILDLENEIVDRINYDAKDLNIFLPSVMLQGEIVPTILTNGNPNNLAIPYNVETQGSNRYAPLYLLNGASPLTRYGWVFYDLRVMVIDHPELATALGYNSNRNFTLPAPKLPNVGNTTQNSTPTNPLTVISVDNSTPINVQTSTNHNYSSGDPIIITNVQGNLAANTVGGVPYYVNVISVDTFQLFLDAGLTIPVSPSGNYIAGTGITYSRKLAYEYFMTYRLISDHYTVVAPYSVTKDFNFETAGIINNSTGQLQVNLDTLTHLVDVNVTTGFEASQWEIIIGQYVPVSTDPYTIDTISNVAYLRGQVTPLVDGTPAQLVAHQLIVTKADYNSAVGTYNYDIIGSDPIYNTLVPLPDTLFTGEGSWLVGNVTHREQVDQYRMTFDYKIAAADWNGTTNPTFEAGNSFMPDKLVTEVAFLLDADTSTTKPYIYGKISPPLKKNNGSDLNIQISIDF